MKIIALLVFFTTSIYAQDTNKNKKGQTVPLSPKEKNEAKIQVALEKPFNPLWIIPVKKEVLARAGAIRVMDMAASSYAVGALFQAVYYYKAILELYPQDLASVTWAKYELAFIYNQLWNKKKALQYLEEIILEPSSDPVAVQLARALDTRLRNPKDYRVYRKQEDILFVQEIKQRREDIKQFNKEEAKRQREQGLQQKEAKRLEKERKAEERRREKERLLQERQIQKERLAEARRLEAEEKSGQTNTQ